MKKIKFIKSICKKEWKLKDGRIAFVKGKEYTHHHCSDLALFGEEGIVMRMHEDNFNKYFSKK